MVNTALDAPVCEVCENPREPPLTSAVLQCDNHFAAKPIKDVFALLIVAGVETANSPVFNYGELTGTKQRRGRVAKALHALMAGDGGMLVRALQKRRPDLKAAPAARAAWQADVGALALTLAEPVIASAQAAAARGARPLKDTLTSVSNFLAAPSAKRQRTSRVQL